MNAESKLLRGRWRVFRNTHLQGPLWLFRLVISEADYAAVLSDLGTAAKAPTHSVSKRFIHGVLKRLLWFWPRIDSARGWAKAGEGDNWGPEKYLRSHQTRLVEKILEVVPPESSLLELGCNCGSDMNQLRVAGYKNLKGVDAGSRALEVFAYEYPQTFELADIRRDLFQRYLMSLPSDDVDYVYSNGATIELVHPSFPIVREICRVASTGVLLDLDECNHGFPRDYVGQFAHFGFEMTYTSRETDGDSSMHVFVFTNTRG